MCANRKAVRGALLAGALIVLGACAGSGTAGSGASGSGAQAAKSHDGGARAGQPKITAAQLLGQSDAWLLSTLGEPPFKRTERTANIWQYKNDACVLNIFLYADGPAETPVRVLHFDARTADGKPTERDRCLSLLQD